MSATEHSFNSLSSIPPLKAILRTPGQPIWLSFRCLWLVDNHPIKLNYELYSTSWLAIEYPSSLHKILQVVVDSVDDYEELSSFEVRAPFLKRHYDRQDSLIVDFIISLYGIKFSRMKSDRIQAFLDYLG